MGQGCNNNKMKEKEKRKYKSRLTTTWELIGT